ncbi:MAG: ATP-binding cassette domain-containing protein [Pseudomonadota bacterium]
MNKRPPAIVVSGITKKYKGVIAVDNVSFEVEQGEMFGFLGPNGAGKTTLIRMLTTLIPKSSGKAMVASFDVSKEPDAVRRAIGVVPQAMTTDLDLTAYENMDIYGRFYEIPPLRRKEQIQQLLEKVGLSARAHDLVASYSGGMRRRLEIVRALMHLPSILFLDEPTIGLDPQSRRVVWDFIRTIRQTDHTTIFLTTHYMEEAEALCNKVAIIDSGKIIAIGSPEELKTGLPGNDVVSLQVESNASVAFDLVKALPFVHKANMENNHIKIYVDNGAQALPLLVQEVHAADAKILSATLHERSLEDVFVHYTGKSIREEETRRVNFFIGAGMPPKFGR